MNFEDKLNYNKPKANIFSFQALNMLEYFSGIGDIDQWEDGEDLGNTEDYTN